MRFNFRLGCAIAMVGLFVTLRSTADQPAPPASASSPAASLSAYSGVGSLVVQTNHLGELGWTDAQINAFLDGARSALKNHRYADDDESRELYQAMARRIQEMKTARDPQEANPAAALKRYEKEVRERFHLQQAESGLCYGIKVNGTGARPSLQDTVLVSIVATSSDGSTPLPVLTNERIHVKVSETLPGLVEGLQMMTAGSQALFMLPPKISFGEGEWPAGIERGTPLFFTVTLFEVIPAGASS